jgi:two-component system, NtrC family, nitrogen regulation sensor histidine kinase NtrY
MSLLIAVAGLTGIGVWQSREASSRRGPRVVLWSASLFLAVAGWQQARLSRLSSDAERWRADATLEGTHTAARTLPIVAEQLRQLASAAVRAPLAASAAFSYLGALPGLDARTGVVVYRNGLPQAWAGVSRAVPDVLRGDLGVERSRFYLILYAAQRRDDAVAVATLVLDADPAAEHLADALGPAMARRAGVEAIEFAPPSERDGMGFAPWVVDNTTLLKYRAVPLGADAARARLLERARTVCGLLLLVWTAVLLLVSWRRRPTLVEQLGSLVVIGVVIAVAPLSALSNSTSLVDPALYFVRVGPVGVAGLGAFIATGALVVLAVLVLRRARARLTGTVAPLMVLAAVAIGGPYLLRMMARGISPPSAGTPLALWIAWQLGVFLLTVSVLVSATAAGRALLRGRVGIDPLLGPSLACMAAALAPVLWRAETAWPEWYTLWWIAVITVTALSRAVRWPLLQLGVVAALGAAVLTWGAVTRRAVDLATIETARLTAPDDDATALLERFADQLQTSTPPRTRADLLERVLASELAARFQVSAESRAINGTRLARLDVFSLADQPVDTRPVAEAAWRSQRAVIQPVVAFPGVFQVLAVPFADSSITTVLVEPETRGSARPLAALLGYDLRATTRPPFTLSLGDVLSDRRLGDGMAWRRDRDALDGSRVVPTAAGPYQLHARVGLPRGWSLMQRGSLLVILDLVVLALLWGASAVTRPGAARWWRRRWRSLASSYRAQLSVALLLFFLVPMTIFTVWSLRRLQGDDAQKRELLVREFLRAVDRSGERPELEQASRRIGVPLLGYSVGRLVDTSDDLLGTLAPFGLFLPPEVALALAPGGSLSATATLPSAGRNVLLSFLSTRSERGERIVVGAPALLEESALAQRREDLVILLLFWAMLGGVAALALSGLAARQFARPIGALRDAAFAVARGERAPRLSGAPPSEFVPVFDAFRGMARDLRRSEQALDAARRQTDAVLRTVASGVIAVDDRGSVVLANPRAEALLGHAMPPATALAALAPALAARATAFATDPKAPAAFEDEWDGIMVQSRFTHLESGGVVITLDDVTELTRAQRVLAWGEMARQVAHEIKNPLTPIRLGVQHLQRARDAGRADFDTILDRNVATILAQIDRLDEIARAFSRYGTPPERAPQPEPTDVGPVVRDVLQLEQMGEHAVRWLAEVPATPQRALARAAELRDVLLNLLENARLSGATTVSVRVHRDGAQVIIAVTDDGSGIPAAVLARVFEPHFSTRTSGSGLGLAISRRVIDGWGGALTIESSEGRGTTVRCALRAVDD